jgi:hypothetical protein
VRGESGRTLHSRNDVTISPAAINMAHVPEPVDSGQPKSLVRTYRQSCSYTQDMGTLSKKVKEQGKNILLILTKKLFAYVAMRWLTSHVHRYVVQRELGIWSDWFMRHTFHFDMRVGTIFIGAVTSVHGISTVECRE